jgi:hypothetical protein
MSGGKFCIRRAFATTMALMLIALVGVAMSAMAMRLSTLARQGRAMREDAQLRQLLLAGTRVAASSPGDGERVVELPAALKDAGAKVVVRIKGREASVEASLGPRRMSQAVTLDQSGKIVRVRLPE